MTLDIRIHTLSTHPKSHAQVSYLNPITRKRIRRKFKSADEAKNYKRQLEREFAQTGATALSGLPMAKFIALYLEAKPNSMLKRIGKPAFTSFIERFAKKPVCEISAQNLSDWIHDLRVEREYSGNTIPNVKTAFSQLFDFIIDKGALTENPMFKVKVECDESNHVRVVLSESEIDDLLEKIKRLSPTVVYPIVFLLAHTGARKSEILNLKWVDVNFELGTIKFLKTKNGDDRLVHASSEVIRFLNGLQRIGDYVVHRQNGTAWTINSYAKQFNKIRRKVGFHKVYTNHCLRHSFAANYLKQGGDMTDLQHILGHRDLQMTVDLYGQIEAIDVAQPSPFDF